MDRASAYYKRTSKAGGLGAKGYTVSLKILISVLLYFFMKLYNVLITEPPRVGVIYTSESNVEAMATYTPPQERIVKDLSRRFFAIVREGEPSLVLSGLAEVTVWITGDGRVAKLEVELLKPYAVDESYVKEFLTAMKW